MSKKTSASLSEKELIIKDAIETKLSRYFGVSIKEASCEQLYKALAMTVKDILSEKRNDYKNLVNKKSGKRVYYMCMEFLIGRSLKNNIWQFFNDIF